MGARQVTKKLGNYIVVIMSRMSIAGPLKVSDSGTGSR